jgi:hypothetical protein
MAFNAIGRYQSKGSHGSEYSDYCPLECDDVMIVTCVSEKPDTFETSAHFCHTVRCHALEGRNVR